MSSYEDSVRERMLTVFLAAAMLIAVGFIIGGSYFAMKMNAPERAEEVASEVGKD
jgi:hypothetical protein